VLDTSPAASVLLPGDIITSLNGQPVVTSTDLIGLIGAADPSQPVTMDVLRDGKPMTVSSDLIPPANPGDPPRVGITIETANLHYGLPFDVDITPQKIAGGPSAGLMFTLTVYDLVTEDDLTCGMKIAGTGTIDYGGNVGPIGGVRQKVAAAEIAGAKYFLSPPANYDDALDAARHIKVVRVETAQQAIDFLHSVCAEQSD
jgi:PDZ domain-containing protein